MGHAGGAEWGGAQGITWKWSDKGWQTVLLAGILNSCGQGNRTRGMD